MSTKAAPIGSFLECTRAVYGLILGARYEVTDKTLGCTVKVKLAKDQTGTPPFVDQWYDMDFFKVLSGDTKGP
jgi:hypothetical protein